MRARHALIAAKGWTSAEAVDQMVPGPHGKTVKYLLKDLTYDCKHRFLQHVVKPDDTVILEVGKSFLSIATHTYDLAEPELVYSMSGVDIPEMGLLTQTQRDVLTMLPDLDVDALVMVQVEHERADGTSTMETHWLMNQFHSPEPELFESESKCFNSQYQDPKSYGIGKRHFSRKIMVSRRQHGAL